MNIRKLSKYKSRPLITAWIGRGNFGDELLAYGLRLELYHAASIEKIDYYGSGRYPIFSAKDDLQIGVVNNQNNGFFNRLLSKFKSPVYDNDCLLFGGGSIFHSENSIRWKYEVLKSFRKSPAGSRGVAGAVGISLGPFGTLKAEELAKEFICDLDFVHCRDRSSADFAKNVSSNCKVIEGRDLAYSVKAFHPNFFIAHSVPDRVGLSFILDPSLSETIKEERFRKMKDIINYLTENGKTVVLFALYTASKYHDEKLAVSLRNAVERKELVLIHAYGGDIMETVNKIGTCSHIISMRLHGCITAYLCGIPFFPINKHPKVREFAISSGLYDLNQEVMDINCDKSKLTHAIDAFVNNSNNAFIYPIDSDEVFKKSTEELRQQFI